MNTYRSMKILGALCLAALLVPTSAWAVAATYSDIGNGVKGVCASGTCDAPVEAAGTTDGLPLAGSVSLYGFNVGAKGVVVTVCADSGQTLSGAGTVTAYVRDAQVALWSAIPDLNFTVTSSARRCQTFTGVAVAYPTGRITWVPTGVTVSGGGVTVYISAGG
jgi:hypothetical protein